jgi:hypothetical protein
MKVSEILSAAKASLTPETWGQGDQISLLGGQKVCAAYAIAEAAHDAGVQLQEPHWRALDLLRQVVGGWIPTWNDAPDTTFADVYEAFSAGIVIAQEQEAAQAQAVLA